MKEIDREKKKIDFGKIGFVAENLYDYQMEVWKLHCPEIFNVLQTVAAHDGRKFESTPMDHLDTVIYNDSDGTDYKIEMKLKLLRHAIELSKRVRSIWYLTSPTPQSSVAREMVYCLWHVSTYSVTEVCRVPQIHCEFKTGQIVESNIDKSFATVDWRACLKGIQSWYGIW